MAALGSAKLGVTTFFASAHQRDQCGSNGLPLTPNSIRILGRFQTLKHANHPNLSQYVDLVRSKNERLFVVSEWHATSVEDLIASGRGQSVSFLQRFAFQSLQALSYMNEREIAPHRNLSPRNMFVVSEGNDEKACVKLSQYGLYYMTDCGREVSFPIGSPRYMAPEVIAKGKRSTNGHLEICRKCDIWSLGMCLLEAYLGCHIWPDLSAKDDIRDILQRIMTLASTSDGTVLGNLLACSMYRANTQTPEMPSELKDFLGKCLTVAAANRASVRELLDHPWFVHMKEQSKNKKNRLPRGSWCFDYSYRSANLTMPGSDDIGRIISSTDIDEDFLASRPIQEVYHLWTLAGGDLESELKRQGLIRTKPAVLQLPRAVLCAESGSIICGYEKDRIYQLNEVAVVLSLFQLKQRLQDIDKRSFYPLLEAGENLRKIPGASPEVARLPLVIREKDVEYQFHRIVLFQRLMEGYPYTRDKILREARIDIPPLMRAKIWAALLDVRGDIHAEYAAIDKETETTTDRQIEVDVPRCHQYNELFSSPSGHAKFKRILKAWVVSHTHWVYWQGLDSLVAPFLHLNFHDEALAFACLKAFVPKYLNDFFLKDNSAVAQEYLAVFSHLIAYHEPELYNHLDEIGFIPELYAIPWFLTMYTHVFPLHKIFHLWDTLLLGNSSLPLCVGVAILIQLKDLLISYGFNECILLFSDMPDVDIQRCVLDSIRVFKATPCSATMRRHDKISVELANSKLVPIKIHLPGSRETSPELQTPDLQSVEMLTLHELKEESCPRITISDTVIMCGLEDELLGHRVVLNSTEKQTEKRSKGKCLVIDIRSQLEFRRGHVLYSINMPFHQAFGNADGKEIALANGPEKDLLVKHKGRPIIIVGNPNNDPPTFGRQLVCLGFPKVSVLLGGVASTLKPLGLLSSFEDGQ